MGFNVYTLLRDELELMVSERVAERKRAEAKELMLAEEVSPLLYEDFCP